MLFYRSTIVSLLAVLLWSCKSAGNRSGEAAATAERSTTEATHGVMEVLRAVHFHIKNEYMTETDMKILSRNALQFVARNYAENLKLKFDEKGVEISCNGKTFREVWLEDEIESLLALKARIEPCISKNARKAFRFYEYAVSNAMLASLPVRGEFFTREKTEEFQTETRGNAFGVGLEIRYEKDDCIIVNTVPGGPAAAAEIPRGSILKKIDGATTAELNLAEVVRKLRGSEGSTVSLEIHSGTKNAPIVKTYALTRKRITMLAVDTSVLEGKILYMKIKTLNVAAAEMVKAAVSGAPNSITGIIVDLRGSAGGLIESIRSVTNPFLKDEFIFETRGRKKELNKKFVTGSEVFLAGKRMIVLTDEGTMAGSEMVAIALQQNGRAKIFGSKTMGMGEVSNIIALMYGNSMRVPIQELYRPDGRSMREFPVKPDVEIPAGEDALKVALKALSE